MYWICFGYIIIESLVWLYHNLSYGINECDTGDRKFGTFLGTIIGIVVWVFTFYFYLH